MTARDQFGNVATSFTKNVTVSITTGTGTGGATLGGTTTVSAVAGVAAFTDLTIDLTGTGYTLDADTSPSLGVATSTLFDIN